MSHRRRPDLLATIVRRDRARVEGRARRARRSSAARLACAARPLRAPARRRSSARCARRGPPRVIAECKRRSPSRGILRADYDPAAHRAGLRGGGRGGDLRADRADVLRRRARAPAQAVRAAVRCRCCARTSSSTSISCVEARGAGADAVLLIVGALDRESGSAAARAAPSWGWRRSSKCTTPTRSRARSTPAPIIGVNSRNLRTLAVDLTCSTLAALPPRRHGGGRERHPNAAPTSSRLTAAGYHAFLVGERLIAARSGRALRAWRARAKAASGPVVIRVSA